MITTRIVFALPLFLSLLAYMINPRWMAWSQMPLPASVRWLGATLGAACIPLIYWVVSSLGRNISETIFTKQEHELVTYGPYRWVRHPLYTVALLLFLGFALLMASWFVAAMIVLAAGMIRLVIIPQEEEALIEKFGEQYLDYRARTGRLFPKPTARDSL